VEIKILINQPIEEIFEPAYNPIGSLPKAEEQIIEKQVAGFFFLNNIFLSDA